MDQQTPTAEGAAVPTPPAGMSPQDSAQIADQQPQVAEAKPAGLTVIEEALGREFSSLEEATTSLKNLNSLVGEQTTSKQRKAIEKIAAQANLTPDELYEVLETQNVPVESVQTDQPVAPQSDEATKRVIRLETDSFVKDTPEAQVIRDTLFAEALSSGKTVREIWEGKYAPIIEAGKKIGAKKLQSNIEGQPLKGTSTASDMEDTKVDFSGVNPTTGKRWTAQEMEQYIGYTPPSQRL